jgi:hypothetical protein
VSAFKQEENNFDISSLKDRAYQLPQLSQGGYNDRFNYDGYLTYSLANYHSSYVQVFRNGCMEIVDNGIINASDKLIYCTRFEALMIEKLPKYLKLLDEYKISGPLLVYITFIGVKGHLLFQRAFFESHQIEKDELRLPKILLRENDGDIAMSLKPAFDVLWNSGGLYGSVNYVDGIWNPRN